ncbi:hypothetical protein [Streptomyces liangshanensis]|uniref:Uncharacterized protein n=1 Tax=Streptomyces liangshanensis TaxID=2717324 RepID=A0A6G9GZU1_9ACTN|nr:hypothetical protein [Streptomyces liangshanensis]QIQ03559.1 hypothetical protein HA039_15590 [Streptomyces liangshanensis]
MALDVPATAEALARYRSRAGMWVRVGLTTAAGGAVVELANAAKRLDWADVVAEVMGGLALAPLLVGLSALRLARLMRLRLAARPWTALPAVTAPHGPHAAAVVLRDPAPGGEPVALTLVGLHDRHRAADPGPDGELWWCGDPQVGGVLARPGGTELIWARTPGRLTRERILAAVRRAEGAP